MCTLEEFNFETFRHGVECDPQLGSMGEVSTFCMLDGPNTGFSVPRSEAVSMGGGNGSSRPITTSRPPPIPRSNHRSEFSGEGVNLDLFL